MAKRPNYSGLADIKTASQIKRENRENLINADIAMIEDAIISKNKDKMQAVHMEIDGKYSVVIPNMGQSMYGYIDNFGFDHDCLGVDNLKYNLILMKSKLKGYLNDFPVQSSTPAPQNMVNVSVPITNEININITFEEARQKIEDMAGLTEADTQEINNKISELEDINNDSISRKKKWEKVKPIALFALDKGADVAITIMGLIMQMKLGM